MTPRQGDPAGGLRDQGREAAQERMRLRQILCCEVLPPEVFLRKIFRGDRDQHLSRAGCQELVEAEAALPLLGAAVAEGEEPAQAAVGGPVHRVGHGLETFLGHEAHAGQEADAGLAGGGPPLRLGMAPHHARQGVAVGDADGVEPELGGLSHHLAGMRGPAEEGEVRGDGELGIGGWFGYRPHLPSSSAAPSAVENES